MSLSRLGQAAAYENRPGPLPDLLVVLAVVAEAGILAVMIARARAEAVALAGRTPQPVMVGEATVRDA